MSKRWIFVGLFLVIFYYQAIPQSLTVQGKVTSSRIPVKQVSVIFTDNVDTTKIYSAVTDDLGYYQIGLPTPIEPKNNLPADFQLAQNYPNPFSSSTAIPYNVNKQSDIKVTIYDILGREVRQFRIGFQTAGVHKILWDGRNSIGQKVSNGIYLYKLQAGGKSEVKKMILNSGTQNISSTPYISLPQVSTATRNIDKLSAGQSYTIRIENTENTNPYIISEQFDNIPVNNDTTINFSVSHLTTVTIDYDSLHQVIKGYGAATPWYLPVATDSEIESAFGTGDGQIGLTIFRLTIDPNSSNWSKWVPSAKKAYEMGAKIIASPWYAPSEMVETVGGISRVRYDMYDEYAAHLDSFVTYMANNDVPIYGISIQNEPDITDQWTSWTSTEMFTFVKENAHAIKGTKVMAPESFHFNRAYSDPILNDSIACANTDVICGHIYGGGLTKYPLAKEKGKEVWMTEYLMGDNNSGNNMYWAMELAANMNDVMIADMNAYVWWTMIRYYGPIGDGTTASNPADPDESYPAKGEVTKKGYVMSQFSKFIRPGDYRVESDVYPPSSTIYVSAYRDTLSLKEVLVAINTGSSAKDVAFNIVNRTMSTFANYTTSEYKNVEQGDDINIDENIIILNLEASSITTFVSN
jgi:glucuronoarabinoxylan endo-1,4-beta-xylanase